MKKSETPLKKHTLFLFEGDYDRLNELYPNAGGAAIIVRLLVRKHIERLDAPLEEVPEVDQVSI